MKTYFIFLFSSDSQLNFLTTFRNMAQTQTKASQQQPKKNYGKVTLVNGDKTVIATAILVSEKELVLEKDQLGRQTGLTKLKSVVKIQSDDGKGKFAICDCEQTKLSRCMCTRWIHQYKDQVVRPSIYASDPVAAAGYFANKTSTPKYTVPLPPRTPTPVVRRPMTRVTSMTSLNLPPMPPQLLLFAQQNPTQQHIRPIPKF